MISKKNLLWVILIISSLILFKCFLKKDISLPTVLEPKTEMISIDSHEQRATQSPQSVEQVAMAELEDFKNIHSKVLLNAEEKKRLQEELSNSDLIRRSYLLLTNLISDVRELNKNEHARLLALDYLEKSVAWPENPARKEALESLKNIMLLDNLSYIDDMSIRKSYAGDKMEAYGILKQYSPEELEVLGSLPEDGRIRRLLKYAENLSQ
ncbi:MAG: hypothetical protein WCK49_05815 [Myxococcaceae bacterium]